MPAPAKPRKLQKYIIEIYVPAEIEDKDMEQYIAAAIERYYSVDHPCTIGYSMCEACETIDMIYAHELIQVTEVQKI